MERGDHAVIMGDLVASERADSRRDVHRRFNAVIDRLNDERRTALASPLTITLGDEFQGLALELGAAMRIARAVRFALMADDLDCRVLVGRVTIETPVNPDRAWNMMGEGLARARERIDRKRDTSLYLFSVPGAVTHEVNLTAMGAGLTAIERRWTRQQREDVLASLAGETAEETARRRGVGLHSVYKVRAAGQHDAYLMLWAAIDNTLATIDMDWS